MILSSKNRSRGSPSCNQENSHGNKTDQRTGKKRKLNCEKMCEKNQEPPQKFIKATKKMKRECIVYDAYYVKSFEKNNARVENKSQAHIFPDLNRGNVVRHLLILEIPLEKNEISAHIYADDNLLPVDEPNMAFNNTCTKNSPTNNCTEFICYPIFSDAPQTSEKLRSRTKAFFSYNKIVLAEITYRKRVEKSKLNNNCENNEQKSFYKNNESGLKNKNENIVLISSGEEEEEEEGEEEEEEIKRETIIISSDDSQDFDDSPPTPPVPQIPKQRIRNIEINSNNNNNNINKSQTEEELEEEDSEIEEEEDVIITPKKKKKKNRVNYYAQRRRNFSNEIPEPPPQQRVNFPQLRRTDFETEQENEEERPVDEFEIASPFLLPPPAKYRWDVMRNNAQKGK